MIAASEHNGGRPHARAPSLSNPTRFSMRLSPVPAVVAILLASLFTSVTFADDPPKPPVKMTAPLSTVSRSMPA